MSEFDFVTDDEAQAFCLSIVSEIERLFGMTHAEALKVVNSFWGGRNLVFKGDDVIYHEDETFWAKKMVLGAFWLKEGE